MVTMGLVAYPVPPLARTNWPTPIKAEAAAPVPRPAGSVIVTTGAKVQEEPAEIRVNPAAPTVPSGNPELLTTVRLLKVPLAPFSVTAPRITRPFDGKTLVGLVKLMEDPSGTVINTDARLPAAIPALSGAVAAWVMSPPAVRLIVRAVMPANASGVVPG
jgi:hypothetical protein